MLAVATSPHGSAAIRLNEATLSQELCTDGLLRPHILVEYQWQNIGLCPEDSGTTSMQATSCRNSLPSLVTQMVDRILIEILAMVVIAHDSLRIAVPAHHLHLAIRQPLIKCARNCRAPEIVR
jgi:hypothetical protein